MSIADLMPTHIVNYLLANGILFDYELKDLPSHVNGNNLAAKISDKAQIMLDTYVWERGTQVLLKDKPTNVISAAIIHAARLEEFNYILNGNDIKTPERHSVGPTSETNNSLQLLHKIRWPKELEQLARCKLSEIEEISLAIIKLNA